MCTSCTFHTYDKSNNSKRYFIFGFGTIKVTEQESMTASRLLSIGAVVKQGAQPMAALGFVSENLVTMTEHTIGEVYLESQGGRSRIRLSSVPESACVNEAIEIQL